MLTFETLNMERCYGVSYTCFDADACAGHSCWGILNGPATGKALAEMIATGASQCVDLTPYDPAILIRKTDGFRRKERLIETERTHLADHKPIGWDSHI